MDYKQINEHKMSTIIFECDVTEYDTIPDKNNDENCFALNDDCLIISFMDTKSNVNDKILKQSEISKKSAIELAKLILLKYT